LNILFSPPPVGRIEPFFPSFNLPLGIEKQKTRLFSMSVYVAEPRKETRTGMPWPWEYERKDICKQNLF